MYGLVYYWGYTQVDHTIGDFFGMIIIYLCSHLKYTDNIYGAVILCLLFSHKPRHFMDVNLWRVSNLYDGGTYVTLPEALTIRSPDRDNNK